MQALKRMVAACAVMAFAVVLAGCLHGHHAEQVIHKPMKLGAADAAVGQVERSSQSCRAAIAA